jgi:hypothetical protein
MKTLTVKSPTQLWTILKNKEEIFESNRELTRFIFVTEKFIKGCQCGSDNKTLMDNQYNFISTNEEIISLLKEELGYDEIIFDK